MSFIELSSFNILVTCFGAFSLVYCIASYFLDYMYTSEPLPAAFFGFVISEIGWADFSSYTNVGQISLDFTRVVLGFQLFLSGIQLPPKYLKKAWISISVLLGPVMTIMWIVMGLCIFLCTPSAINFGKALIIAACITPTDPVLCGSIVKGRFAEAYVSKELQDIIIAESGANDGFGYPFLFLALYIYRYSGTEIAKHWLLETVLYEVVLGVVYGGVIGFLGQTLFGYLKKRERIDDVAYSFTVVAVSGFIMGTAGLIGTDDLLACFVAGNTFTWK